MNGDDFQESLPAPPSKPPARDEATSVPLCRETESCLGRRTGKRRLICIAAIGLTGAIVVLGVCLGAYYLHVRNKDRARRVTVGGMEFRSFDDETNLSDVTITPIDNLVSRGPRVYEENVKGFEFSVRGGGWIFAFDQSGSPLPMTTATADASMDARPACALRGEVQHILLAIIARPERSPDAERRAREWVHERVQSPTNWLHACALIEIMKQLDQVDDPVMLDWLAWLVESGAEEIWAADRGIPAPATGYPRGPGPMRAEAAATAYAVSGFATEQRDLVIRLLQSDPQMQTEMMTRLILTCHESSGGMPPVVWQMLRQTASTWSSGQTTRMLDAANKDLDQADKSTRIDLVDAMPPRLHWEAIQALGLRDETEPRLAAAVREQIGTLRKSLPRDVRLSTREARLVEELFEYLRKHDRAAFLDEVLAEGTGSGPFSSLADRYLKHAIRAGDFDFMRRAAKGEGGIRIYSSMLLPAVQKGDLEELRVMIESVEDIDALTFEGSTLLHAAAGVTAADGAAIVELLLEHGADPNVLDRRDTPPLDVALARDNQAVAAALRSRGAKTHEQLRVQIWAARVNVSNPVRAAQAVEQLRQLGPGAKGAMPALIEALRKNPHGRDFHYSLMKAIYEIDPGNKEMIPAMKSTLGHTDAYIRATTAYWLWKMTGDIDSTLPVAVDVLRQCALSDGPTPAAAGADMAATLLSEMGSPAHEAVLAFARWMDQRRRRPQELPPMYARTLFKKIDAATYVECLTHEDPAVRDGATFVFTYAKPSLDRDGSGIEQLKKLLAEGNRPVSQWAKSQLPATEREAIESETE